MAEPSLSDVEAHVRRYDPALFRTALFAPEPQRARLMTLYAFDIELSRALSRATEPMIALMRVQWWRDVVTEARDGKAPRAHEVAGPLHALLGQVDLDVEPLFEARGLEIQRVAPAAFLRWAELRFGALIQLAGEVLDADLTALSRPAGRALGMAFALRTAARMAAEGRHLLPLEPSDRANPSPERLMALAGDGLDALREARELRRSVPKAAVPALLTLTDAETALRMTHRHGVLPPEEAQPRPLLLLARAVTGRW